MIASSVPFRSADRLSVDRERLLSFVEPLRAAIDQLEQLWPVRAHAIAKSALINSLTRWGKVKTTFTKEISKCKWPNRRCARPFTYPGDAGSGLFTMASVAGDFGARWSISRCGSLRS